MGITELFTAVSLFALIAKAIQIGIAPTFALVIAWHDWALSKLLGWADPYLQAGLAFLGKYFDVQLVLHSHWRHIFFLLTLYFGAYVSDALYRKYHEAARFYFLIGLPIALVSAIGSGLFQMSSPGQGASWSDALLAAWPLFGVVLFSLLTAYRAAKWYRPKGIAFGVQLSRLFQHPMRFAAIGVIVIAACILSANFLGSAAKFNSAYVALLVLTLALATYRIALRDAWQGAELTFPASGSDWLTSIKASGGGRVGWRMLKAFLLAVLLAATNVGQNLLSP